MATASRVSTNRQTKCWSVSMSWSMTPRCRGKRSVDTYQIVPNSGLLELHKGKDGSDITADVQGTYQARGVLSRRSTACESTNPRPYCK
eukprot:909466-Amphidinium_carterae.1